VEEGLFLENERTASIIDDRQAAHLGPFKTRTGFAFENLTIAFETWGTLNADRSNAILICHALSGDAHAIGWWDRMVGAGKAIDTDHFYVIGQNVLGGCQGSTGPSTIASDGAPYGSRFPIITVEDMVSAQVRLLDYLGISRLHAVAGGSMGGMQALAWAAHHSDRVHKVFCTASAAKHNAMQIGFNEVGRQAIMRDPKWLGGDYPLDDPPANGLSVARMLGHLSFLSPEAFESKFGRQLQDKLAFSFHREIEFQVESYLNYQGDKFTKRFDANSQIVLTRAIDYFDLTSLAGSTCQFLFVSFDSDWIYPTAQSVTAHRLALDAGCRSEHHEISLPYGHDSFLLDGELQGARVRAFLAN
jgi:homoserine O-acetyltransferase